MADISNSCRPWNPHAIGTVKLEEEFFAQGDMEWVLGVPMSMMMDRTKDSLAASQGFWITGMVGPLYTPFRQFLEQETAQTLTTNMQANKRVWDELIEKHGKKTAWELVMLAGQQGLKTPKGRARKMNTQDLMMQSMPGNAARLKEAFRKWDKERNGVISKHELYNFMKLANPVFQDTDLDKMMREADQTGFMKGQIKYDQFVNWAFAEDDNLHYTEDP